MKICRLIRYLPSGMGLHGWIIGGYYLSKAQAEMGHRVFIVSGEAGRYPKHEKVDGFEVIRTFSSVPKSFHLKTIAYGLSSLKEIRRLDRSIGIDIIHGHDKDPMIYGMIHKISRKKPFVLHSHGLTASWKKMGIVRMKIEGKGLGGIVNRIADLETRALYEKVAHKAADLIFAVSEAYGMEISSEFGIPKEKIHVTYNGVDTARFNPIVGARGRLGIGTEEKILLMVGGDTRKGIHTMLRASKTLARNRKFRLIIIGATQMDVNRILGREGPRIEAIESVPYDMMPLYYNAADIFVLPTLYETFGKAIAEAMACGKPVVTTRVGGVPEVVDEGKTGLLAKVNNHADFAEKIDALLESDSICRKMGNAGRKKVEKMFTWDKVASRVEEGYKKL